MVFYSGIDHLFCTIFRWTLMGLHVPQDEETTMIAPILMKHQMVRLISNHALTIYTFIH